MFAQWRVSGHRPALSGAVLCLALLYLAIPLGPGTTLAADPANLVAPVYPGAVPAMTGTRPAACERGEYLSKDPIDKVKAFYDKAVGPLKQTPQPYGQRSYGAVLEVGERTEEGTPVSSLGIHALGPPLTAPTKPGQVREAYEKGALGWNAAWGPIHVLVYMVAWSPDMQDPLMYPYTLKEVDALARKYNRTQSYFYVTDAATGKSRADVLSDQFSERSAKLRQDALTGNLSAQQSIAASAGREGEKIAAEDMQDDPEFNRIMQRKPALNKKYTALMQKMQQQMMQGKYDAADQTADESDRLLRSDPEMAALMKRYDERDQRREGVAAKAQAQSSAAQAGAFGQFSRQNWDAAVQALDQLVKEGYSTFIAIDCRLGGKGVKRDRAEFAAWDAGLHHAPAALGRQVSQYKLAAEELGIKPAGDTPEQVAAAREAAKPKGAGPAVQTSAPAQAQQPAKDKPKQKVARQPPPEKKPGAGEQAADAAKKGFNALKKLF